MKLVITSVIISCILLYLNVQDSFVYLVSVIGLSVSIVLLYPVITLSSSLKAIDSAIAEKLYLKWSADVIASKMISNLLSITLLLILTFLTTLFSTLNTYLILILLGVASLLTVRQLVLYLRRTYLEELTDLLEELHNDD